MSLSFRKMGSTIILLISCFSGWTQSAVKDYPVIGQPIPAFVLTKVHGYEKKTFDPLEVKRKWIVMDFWYTGCTACVKSFPKVNQLNSEFKNDILFLLVGKNDKKDNENIEQVYERFREHFGLTLPYAFDSVLFERFKIVGAPHVIILDPQRKVYTVTLGSGLTRSNLQALIEYKNPLFTTKYYDFETPSDMGATWKYREDEHKMEGRDFLYRSVLSAYQGEAINGSYKIDDHSAQGLINVIGATLSQLYRTAYLGEGEWGRGSGNGVSLYLTHAWTPAFEIVNASHFQANADGYKELYNYSLVVPASRATKKYLMEVMQRELQNYFGYDVSIETRMMPCWKLSATDNSRRNLKTNSQTTYIKFEASGMEGKKIPVSNILDQIELYGPIDHLPLIDDTGIQGEIDINLNAVMTDMEDVKKALKKCGLILEKSEKEMKVLVVRDARLDN